MPNNKLKVASLFCGCGGSDLGMVGGFEYLGKRYEELPFEIVYAADFDQWAVDTYNKNFKHKILIKIIQIFLLSAMPVLKLHKAFYPEMALLNIHQDFQGFCPSRE